MSSFEEFPESSRVEILEDDEDEEEFVDCCEDPLPSSTEEDQQLNNEFNSSLHMDETSSSRHHVDNEKNEESTSLQEANLEDAFACEKDITQALAAKEKGNDYFRNKDYDNAIQCYSTAIDYCPRDPEYLEQLATFYGNRAAAYAAEDEHDLVIEDCTSALELKTDYIKVLVRRMQAYEKLQKFEEALTDAKKVQELDPATPKIQATINRLQKLHEEKMEKLKDEALGKLKELGNSLLGNFGLSLDNFKMQQDPNTGSWSFSMNK